MRFLRCWTVFWRLRAPLTGRALVPWTTLPATLSPAIKLSPDSPHYWGAGGAARRSKPALPVGPEREEKSPMKAVVVTEPGGPEVLQVQDLPEPTPGPGQVQIR